MAGQLSMVQWLMGSSCSIDACDAQGQTAVIAATAYGHKAVVECLLDASCDVLATDVALRSALHVAASTCSSTLLPLLLPLRSSSVHACDDRDACTDSCARSEPLLNAADIDGHTPLLLALLSKVLYSFHYTPHTSHPL
jgi:ankyrin repeat protein